MNRAVIFVVALAAVMMVVSTVVAEEEPDRGEQNFVSATAYTVDQGQWQVGIFGPLRYGVSDRIEVSAHPLWFFVAPNLRAKVEIAEVGPVQMSWQTGVTYPTPLLRILSMEGAGGVHPPDRAVPHIISIFNEFVATADIEGHLVTGGVGVQVAPRFGDSQMVSIDTPVVYPRTAAFFTGATIVPRLEVQGHIAWHIGYRSGLKGFIYPGAQGTATIEGAGRLRWQSSPGWMIEAGYLATYGGYPFGREFRLLPTVDMMWAF